MFEIPLTYYNTLPNSQRFTGELTSLIDAVIQTLHDELHHWERGNDAKFLLCDVLKEQFLLLVKNYKNCPKLSNNIPISENIVVNTVFRKIKKILSETPEPDDFDQTMDEMKAAMR